MASDRDLCFYKVDRFLSIREKLEHGELVTDHRFDDIYPLPMRRLSSMHWTPVRIAVQATRLLTSAIRAIRAESKCGSGDERPVRLLDIGSGVGKFCIVAAAAFPEVHLYGVEHRPHLVKLAEQAAIRVGVESQVTFTHGTLSACDSDKVDGVYLYNPFAENVCTESSDHIDATVTLSTARFVQDVLATEDFLHRARIGTCVLTYCGFGGELSNEYKRVTRVGPLSLWIKKMG